MKSAKLFASLLLLVCSLSFFSCVKQDDLPGETKEILTQGQWKVSYYFSDQDHTNQFSDYNFTFNQNGSLTSTNNNVVYNGTWKVIRNVNGFDLLEMNLSPVNAELQQLNLTWKITAKTLSQMNMTAQSQSQFQLRISKN